MISWWAQLQACCSCCTEGVHYSFALSISEGCGVLVANSQVRTTMAGQKPFHWAISAPGFWNRQISTSLFKQARCNQIQPALSVQIWNERSFCLYSNRLCRTVHAVLFILLQETFWASLILSREPYRLKLSTTQVWAKLWIIECSRYIAAYKKYFGSAGHVLYSFLFMPCLPSLDMLLDFCIAWLLCVWILAKSCRTFSRIIVSWCFQKPRVPERTALLEHVSAMAQIVG